MKPNVTIGTAILFLPVLLLCAAYSVNVPTWDQWSYFDHILGAPGSMFFYQYMHHRMGFGGLVVWATSRMTNFNISAINYATVAFLLLSTLLALKIQKTIAGSSHWKDIVIPACMLTVTQAETFVTNSSLLQVAAPEFLLLLYVIGWCAGPFRFQTPALAALQFLILFSGYGETFFPVIMAFLFLRFKRDACALPLFACGALSSASFFLGLNLAPIEGSLMFSPTHSGMFLMRFGQVFTQTSGNTAWAIGGAFLAALIFVLARSAWRVFNGGTAADAALFLISGCVLSYMFDSSMARNVVASRYMTITSLGFASIFMASRRSAVVGAFIFGLAVYGSFTAVANRDRFTAFMMADRASGWLDCYQAYGDWRACNQQANIYPTPDKVHMGDKLEFMRQHKLSFFAEVQP